MSKKICNVIPIRILDQNIGGYVIISAVLFKVEENINKYGTSAIKPTIPTTKFKLIFPIIGPIGLDLEVLSLTGKY